MKNEVFPKFHEEVDFMPGHNIILNSTPFGAFKKADYVELGRRQGWTRTVTDMYLDNEGVLSELGLPVQSLKKIKAHFKSMQNKKKALKDMNFKIILAEMILRKMRRGK